MNNDELQVLGTENRKSNNRKWIIAAVCVVLSIVCLLFIFVYVLHYRFQII